MALTAAVFVYHPSNAEPNKPQGPDDIASSRPVSLPIGQVVLFSSGVGYFQREGSVEGDARVDLSFPTTDINDLIKSMVLRDLNGGHISTVSYESNAPVERTLKSFAINLTGNPGFAQILNQARGEKVEVSLLQANNGQPATLTGTVIGVEKPMASVRCISTKWHGCDSLIQWWKVSSARLWKHWLCLTIPSRSPSAFTLRARASAKSALAMWWRIRCGRRAIGSCWTRRTSRICKAGPWWKMRRTKIGKTCAWR
jgi:hypothetical protein